MVPLCYCVVLVITMIHLSSSTNSFTFEPTTESPSLQPTNEPFTSPPTSLPTSNPTIPSPTTIPTTSVPTALTCKDRCDAFSVMIDNYTTNADEICINYKVSRLLFDGLCSESIKSLILGLCHNDSDIINGKELNKLIQSLYVNNEKYNKYVRGTHDGIRLNIDIDQDASFQLCLKDIFQTNASVSNAVTFLRANNEFECDEIYLNGLPCIDIEKFTMMIYDDDTENNNDEEVVEYDMVDINGGESRIMGTYGRWIVLSVVIEVISILAVILYFYVRKRKKSQMNQVVAVNVEQAIELQTIRSNSYKKNKSLNKNGENVLSESDDGDDKMDADLNGNVDTQQVMLCYDSDDIAKKE